MLRSKELKKNALYEMTVEDVDADGFGIGRIQGMAVFAATALPGDRIRVRILKVKPRYAYGKIEKILEPSPYRREPVPCAAVHRCGGCQWLHCDYEAQLIFKKRIVENALRRIGKIDHPPVADTLGAESPLHYRNKAQFPVGADAGIGFYAPRSHRIIPVKQCLLQHPSHEAVLAVMRDYIQDYGVTPYQEETHTGLLRHIVIRSSRTNELMVVPVINGRELPNEQGLVAQLSEAGVTTIVINTQTARTNVIMGNQNRVLYGDGYLRESLGDITYRLSAKSFFQVNPAQAQILYDKAIALAAFKGTETIIDAHAGVGGVALYAAKSVRKVYGVEIVPEAVIDAQFNAAENGITNAMFIQGAAEDVIPALLKNGGEWEPQAVTADAVLLDPPRKGCNPALIAALIDAQIPQIIYISCEPSTLARDIKQFCESGYRIESVQPVDMFPMTGKVEVVTSLRQ